MCIRDSSIVFVIGGNIMYGTPYFGYAFFEDALMMVATFCSLQMLYLVGLADDLIGIKYRAKFVVQLICAALIISAGCWFHTLAGALGINEFPSLLAIPFTAVVIVFIINAINLIPEHNVPVLFDGAYEDIPLAEPIEE